MDMDVVCRWWSIVSNWDEVAIRNWVSALSGWAALLAGIVTVAKMNTQIKEQRRQNDFIVGDMPPEMWVDTSIAVFEGGFRGTVTVSITNMNRRPLYIRAIECITDSTVVLGCRTFKIDGKEVGERLPAIFPITNINRQIPGRKIGSHAPVCEVECAIYVDGKLPHLSMKVDDWNSREITVRLSGNWNGSGGESISLVKSVRINY